MSDHPEDPRDPSSEPPPAPPGLGPLDADVPHVYVVGFPLFVGITVRVNMPDAGLRRLPLPVMSRLSDAVGLVLQDPVSGEERARVDPSPDDSSDSDGPTFNLLANEARRMLVEVSDVLSWTPGRHALKVIYASSRSRAESAPAPIGVYEPRGPRKDELDALAPERARAGTWGAWVDLPAADPARLGGPFDSGDPLVYLRVLRYLRQAPEPLAAIDPAVLDALTGVYAPEARMLRAELAWARGDRAAFDAIAGEVRRDAPALDYWLAKIIAGSTDLAFARALRKPSPP